METKLNVATLCNASVGKMELKSVKEKDDGTYYKVLDVVPGAAPSNHRNGETAPVRLSGVAMLFDKIYRHQVCAFTDTVNGGTYVEIDGHALLVNGGSVQIPTGSEVKKAYTLWALAIDFFLKEKKLNFPKSGIFSAETMATMCDDFLYGAARNVTVTDDLVLETLTAAYRSGLLSDILPAYGCAPKCFTMVEPLGEQKKTAKKEKKARELSDDALWEEIKSGRYIVNYEWDERSKKKIVPLTYLNKYVPNEIFFLAFRKIEFRFERILSRLKNGMTGADAIGTDTPDFIAVGSPGTGKSVLAYALAAAFGLPLDYENCSPNTEESDFEGKTKMVSGKPASVPTAVLERTLLGGVCLLEEINLIKDAGMMQACLGQVIEYPYQIKRDGYRSVPRHPLCLFIGTMNCNTSGSRAVSEPFDNRMKTTYVFEDPKKKTFIRMLVERTGVKEYICTWVYEIYDSIVKMLDTDAFGASDTDSLLMVLSLRSCIGVVQNIEEGIPPKKAVMLSIINKIAARDPEAAEKLAEMVESKRDLYMEEGDIYEDK